jgi:5-methylcytosine-specific restriction enzyme subunit McrC
MLLAWLSYAAAHSRTVKGRRTWAKGAVNLVDLIIAAYLEECRALVRGQLRKDYVRQDDVDVVLRGRLDFARQATQRFGMLDKLHVRTFDRRVDVWENEVCGAALVHAARITGNGGLRRDAGELAALFPSCSPMSARATLARARHHRMNLRYLPAHSWAGLLLNSGGVADLLSPGELGTDSLLLDMNRLWETVVRRMVTAAAKSAGASVVPSTKELATRVGQPGHRSSTFHPDVLVRDSGLLAVDAKYKRYDQHAVSNSDVHQLLTYASSYGSGGVPRTVIVHPSGADTATRRVSVRGPAGSLGVIDVVGLSVAESPEANVLRLAGFLFDRQIAHGAQR